MASGTCTSVGSRDENEMLFLPITWHMRHEEGGRLVIRTSIIMVMGWETQTRFFISDQYIVPALCTDYSLQTKCRTFDCLPVHSCRQFSTCRSCSPHIFRRSGIRHCTLNRSKILQGFHRVDWSAILINGLAPLNIFIASFHPERCIHSNQQS